MKKLKLNELNLSNDEVLTRDQLRKVLGGLGSSGSGGGRSCSGSCDVYVNGIGTVAGTCKTTSWPGYDHLLCYCSNGLGTC